MLGWRPDAAEQVSHVEFLSYEKAVENLKGMDVHPVESGDDEPLISFALEAEGAESASIGPQPDGALPRTLSVQAEEIPSLLDTALHAFHVQDVMVVPAAVWREVLDLIAFDLATDEAWQDIDAEANLHARSRDPLLMSPDDRETLLAIVRGVLGHGESERVGLSILAVGSPVVVRLGLPAEMRLSCPQPVMETVMGKLEEVAG